MKLYINNDEVGPARETSHPSFVEKLQDEMYYNCLDEFSPFGNDQGADALFSLEEWYQETGGKGDIMEWLFDYVDSMGFEYSCESTYQVLDKEALNALEENDPSFLKCMDDAIIGAAFGQYKITGLIDARLKEAGSIACQRILLSAEDKDITTPYQKMRADLAKLP